MANEFKIKKGLIINGSGNTPLDITGDQGQLFSVTDNLVGDIFSVNDISGLPILTVNSEDKVTMGTFGTNALVVNGDKVGIGTTSPAYPLDVNGGIRTILGYIRGANSNADINLDGSVGSRIRYGGQSVNLDSANVSFRTNSTERMRITSTGNVGIGTTSPSAKLDVNGDALINGIIVGAGQGNANNNTIIGKNAFGSNSSGEFNVSVGNESLNQADASFNTAIGAQAGNQISTGNGNIVIGSLDMSGNYAPAYDITTEDDYISMGTTSTQEAYINVAWSVLSDARYKTEFNEIPHGLDFVKQLNPISYKLRKNKDTEETIGNKSYGFKAQDILALEGDNPVIINNSKEDRLTYKESNLIPILVKAIQDLSKEVELLKQIVNNK